MIMLNRAATVYQVCEYFNGNKGRLPLIVDVQNKADYRAILDGITVQSKYLRLSTYFNNLPFPDVNRMRSDILTANNYTVVLGLFQYYAFNGGEAEIFNAIEDIANVNSKILVLTFGIRDIIEKKVTSDIRLQERAQIYYVGGHQDVPSKISLTSYNLKSQDFYNNLNDYFLFLEENGCGYGIIKSSFTKKAFVCGIWNVLGHNTAFELLKEMDCNFAELDESYGTNQQWEELLSELKGTTFKDLLFALGVDLISALKKVKELNYKQKWQLFLWLKSDPTKGYLSLVAQNAKSIETINTAIYNSILAIDPTHKNFTEYYLQRKELMLAIDDFQAIREFINLSNSKGQSQVYYLTNATEIERKEIIKFFTKYDYSLDKMQKITQEIYPLLGEYLSTFVFDNEILDTYFEAYKIQKVNNILSDEFKQIVNAHAISRPFYNLQTRAKVLSQINSENSIVYWVDALGAEFCGLINQRCKHYGLSVRIQIARSELPTLTKFNKDFKPLIADKSIDLLDKLKHEGVGDYDYTKTSLPLYIESELNIIDGIIKTAQVDLANKKKVIIVSDHGASRLVRIANNILTIVVDTKEGEKDEKHGGRCCAWDSDVPKLYDTVTDSDNNGFCVIANYDRFQGGKYTGVELHGGATLEEVIVPIIEITNKTTDYTYSLGSQKLELRGRKAELLMISLSSKIENPKIKIQGQIDFISPINSDESTYLFETNINKSGNYQCSFFNGNEEIIHKIDFEVKSALGSINDLL